MSFFLHEMMELVLLISAIAVTWAVPRPAWVSSLYTRIAKFFGSTKTYNQSITLIDSTHPDLYTQCFGCCAFFLLWGYFIIDQVIL